MNSRMDLARVVDMWFFRVVVPPDVRPQAWAVENSMLADVCGQVVGFVFVLRLVPEGRKHIALAAGPGNGQTNSAKPRTSHSGLLYVHALSPSRTALSIPGV